MKKLVGGLLLAASLVGVGATAHAADINATNALTFNGSTSDFGAAFGTGTTGKTFSESFTFNYSNPFSVSSAVISIALSSLSALDINSFTLSGNGQTYAGTKTVIDSVQFFTLNASNLASGMYTLAVNGAVTGSVGGSFGGNISIAAVPEASTYAMMLGGLALVGFGALRRRRDGGNAALQAPSMMAA